MNKLRYCILFDLLGVATYLIPVFGEWIDIVWAPAAAWLYFKMFGGRVGVAGGIVTFIEEVLPWTDFIPTFTLTWLVQYGLKKRTKKSDL